MNILGIDCSGGACSAALYADGRITAHRFVAAERGHARLLLPLINQVLAEAHCTYPEIDRFGVTIGPGSYTGIRIGLATARGMASATAKPLYGVTTTRAVAHRIARQFPDEIWAGRSLAVCLDTKRKDVYLQCFDRDLVALGEPAALSIEASIAALPEGPILVVGSAAPDLVISADRADVVALSPDHGLTDAIDIARITVAAPATDPSLGAAMPSALYLRAPDVTLPKTGTL